MLMLSIAGCSTKVTATLVLQSKGRRLQSEEAFCATIVNVKHKIQLLNVAVPPSSTVRVTVEGSFAKSFVPNFYEGSLEGTGCVAAFTSVEDATLSRIVVAVNASDMKNCSGEIQLTLKYKGTHIVDGARIAWAVQAFASADESELGLILKSNSDVNKTTTAVAVSILGLHFSFPREANVSRFSVRSFSCYSCFVFVNRL